MNGMKNEKALKTRVFRGVVGFKKKVNETLFDKPFFIHLN